MMHGIAWALALEGVAPIERLVALFLANNYRWADSLTPSSTESLLEVDLYASSEWIGCDVDDVIHAIQMLRAHGLRDVSLIDEATVRYRLPMSPASLRRTEPSDPIIQMYVIAAGAATKIGIARDATARMSNLQASSPLETLTLCFTISGPASKIRKAERECHRRMAQFALRNEWFSSTPGEAIAVVRSVIDEFGVADK